MNLQTNCIICQKHKNFYSFVGEVIAESGGLVLTHFPFVPDESATRGHLIVEPRRHITQFEEMTSEEASAVGGLIQAGVKVVKSTMNAEHVYLFRINDKTPHLHFHLVPRYAGTPAEFWGLKIMGWPGRNKVGLEQIRQISTQLRTAIEL